MNQLTSADGLPLVEEVEDVPRPLVVDLEDGPQRLNLKLVTIGQELEIKAYLCISALHNNALVSYL